MKEPLMILAEIDLEDGRDVNEVVLAIGISYSIGAMGNLTDHFIFVWPEPET